MQSRVPKQSGPDRFRGPGDQLSRVSGRKRRISHRPEEQAVKVRVGLTFDIKVRIDAFRAYDVAEPAGFRGRAESEYLKGRREDWCLSPQREDPQLQVRQLRQGRQLTQLSLHHLGAAYRTQQDGFVQDD